MHPPDRILMGPGPSDVHPRVLQSLGHPLIGHLDPDFTPLLDRVGEQLRTLFGTSNRVTFPVSGTGSAGMEATVVNLVEPGDDVVVGVNGVFGGRIAEVARRAGANVHTVEAPWGRIIDPQAFLEEVRKRRPAVAALVHAETSTGAHQPVAEIGEALRGEDTLLLLDCVTSLAGVEVAVDAWGVDAGYSGTQKCLSVPPGLSPVTFSDRAVAKVRGRASPVQSWYLDLTLLLGYLDAEGGRTYHHTAPVSMIYGLAEGLDLVLEEGVDARIARHAHLGGLLQDGLTQLGLPLLAQEGHRLPQLTTVGLPDGVDEAAWRARLLKEYGIEVGGGLGDFAGRAWRIGLMGHSCDERNVRLLLAALERLLDETR
ncbi:alanine--glyoxylate aminotransferase family protein [Egibacter rhizosphaerae]|uniref:Alanine--glyoxylate aminotransferase family protein n=1 Tax=Egibacter rhizosphaerae TaxID=1670831 RepID=A0A411YCB5_9ACTN|nr:alanine--glyoxylate aminotransferase family protein [Egibacter rhizosphaerae]QBI18787.1 alanine--glyoxylate aminotransferase family protein [Egibacter rhizosphaerae]